MVLYYEWGSTTEALGDEDLRTAVRGVLEQLGEKKNVLVVPPDFTRFNSKAGVLTQHVYEYYGDALKDVLPALGTHDPVSGHQRERMFGPVPESLFRVHDWRYVFFHTQPPPHITHHYLLITHHTTPHATQINTQQRRGHHWARAAGNGARRQRWQA